MALAKGYPFTGNRGRTEIDGFEAQPLRRPKPSWNSGLKV